MLPAVYGRCKQRCVLLIMGMLVQFVAIGHSQTWSWLIETVDSEGGTFNSIAIDSGGNIHIGYLSPDGGGTKYAFRDVSTGRWFNMVVDGNNGFVSLALDSHDKPHLCYMPFGKLKYAWWDGKKWQIQEIAPGSGSREYSCGIAISGDDVPQLTWYQYTDPAGNLNLHIRHAALNHGEWQARTLDFGPETGKWNCVRADARGNIYVAYSAFRERAFRYATWNQRGPWTVATIEDGIAGRKDETTPGMGNAMVLDKNGKPNFAYRDESTLRYAWPDGDHWRIDVVDPNANPFGNLSWVNLRTALALDVEGRPHIAYEVDGTLKHAWWDGSRWRVQPMGIAGAEHRNPSLAISQDNTIYMSYTDPKDRSLKVLIGRPEPAQSASEKTSGKIAR